MRDALLLDRGERTFVIVFDKGDEVVDGLTAFARRQTLRASQVTAIAGLMIAFSSRHSITLKVSDCFDPTSASQ